MFASKSPPITAGLSKARILLGIQPELSQFSVPPFMIMKAAEALALPIDKLCRELRSKFGSDLLVVRSSAGDEDGEIESNAGAYESVLGVSADNADEIQRAVRKVCASLTKGSRNDESDEIFFQLLIKEPLMSGVIFTRELSSGAPYYVVNYDDQSGLTNTVTSGDGEYANRTLYIHRGAVDQIRSDRFLRLLKAVQELETLLDNDVLDIEFAVDHELRPHLFQVRALTTAADWEENIGGRVDAALVGVQSFLKDKFSPQAGVFGSTTIFGQMPDWNPAEMIGRAPRALSLSLYRRLITDDAWRLAREIMGYSVPTGQPLMVSLAGQPFIDTRLSFHSYLPANLQPEIADKLVNAWVQRLRERPELHDKVEFDIAITTFSFDLDDRMDTLASCLELPERETFRDALLGLTQPLVQGLGEGSIAAALARIDQLAKCEMPEPAAGLTGLNRLIEQCVRYGTVPFSILARHGFIARTFLLSLLHRGALDEFTVARLQGGVRTVASELLDDIHTLQNGALTRAEFMQRYGHLRPGTYDILSPRYDQMDTFGASPISQHITSDKLEPFSLSAKQREAVDHLLLEAPFPNVDCDGLMSYISTAISGREYGKFVFTRSVSAMLELIADYGERHGVSRDELSHVPLEVILESGATSGDGRSIQDRLRTIAMENVERHRLTSAIRLPQVLFDEAGVHIVPFQVSQPNFITVGKVSADALYLGPRQSSPDLLGRIVLIENADPGYDWIFAQSIAGLITKYGGANSHMAIRCAEFGIPAAIGCGEQRFDALLKATRLNLDCAVGLITPIH